MRRLRADLHIHSWHSRQSGNLRFLRSRDCYSDPAAVYAVAKARGMDLVTITDHDSIDGGLEFLDRHPDTADFILGEEVSCRFPGTELEVHLGVYGTTERLHRELQPLRDNVFDVAACLREAGVFFSLNHLLHFYRRQAPLSAYLRLLEQVPALETRNGTMLAAHNALTATLAGGWQQEDGRSLTGVGGSDAHTLRRIGTTWTEAPGRTREEFLQSLRQGHASARGAHGNTATIAMDAYGVIAAYVASLAGVGPRDHRGLERVLCLMFSAVSLPAQFLPVVIAGAGKWREAREVRRTARELSAWRNEPECDAMAPEVQV